MAASQTQAKFVNLDGKVLVKKVNSVQWVQADFHTTLDKGDLVQTGPEGVARITFGDRTSYTVKPDTLITVEENSMASNKPTSVAVRINTGSVDLATPNWSSPDSKAAVSVEDSTAQLASNRRAAVKADPETKENEIVMARGSAEVQRGAERIELAQFQKATLPKGGPITKTDVLAPPEPLQPLNLAPIIAENPKQTSIHFEWKPVQDAVSYTLRISTTTMFTKAVKQPTVTRHQRRRHRARCGRLLLERRRDRCQETIERSQRHVQVHARRAGQDAGNGAGDSGHAAARARRGNHRAHRAGRGADRQRADGAEHRSGRQLPLLHRSADAGRAYDCGDWAESPRWDGEAAGVDRGAALAYVRTRMREMIAACGPMKK